MLKLWCDSQVNVKNRPFNENTVCSLAKLIFKRQKEDKSLKLVTVGLADSKVAVIGIALKKTQRRQVPTDKEAAACYPAKLKFITDDGGYTNQTIFNVNETCLFWKKMPKKTFIAREEKTFPGFKATKDRLRVMVGANAAGDCKFIAQNIQEH